MALERHAFNSGSVAKVTRPDTPVIARGQGSSSSVCAAIEDLKGAAGLGDVVGSTLGALQYPIDGVPSLCQQAGATMLADLGVGSVADMKGDRAGSGDGRWRDGVAGLRLALKGKSAAEESPPPAKRKCLRVPEGGELSASPDGSHA